MIREILTRAIGVTAEVLGARRVYTIAFACDQTLEYWTGSFEFPDNAARFTFLGKEAWRTADKREAEKYMKLIEAGGGEPMLGNPQWEFLLNKEDWTW